MDTSFFQKILITILLALLAAGAIHGARNFAGSVEKSMDADLPGHATPKPTPRRF